MNTQDSNVSERTQDSPVDLSALAQIFGDNTDAQFNLLRKFVVQMDEILAALEAALDERDSEQVKFHAHKLKSSARAVGANHVSDVCFELETAGREGDWSRIDPQVGNLRSGAAKVRDYVAAL